MKDLGLIFKDSTSACGVWTLANHQVPTKLLYHSPLLQQERGRKYINKLVGQDGDWEITYQLLLQAKQTQLGLIN